MKDGLQKVVQRVEKDLLSGIGSPKHGQGLQGLTVSTCRVLVAQTESQESVATKTRTFLS